MNELKKEIQEMVKEQRKTNRTLDYWSSIILFEVGMITGRLEGRTPIGILGYMLAALAVAWQLMICAKDIKEIIDEPDEEEVFLENED